jgi:hypothetical protein
MIRMAADRSHRPHRRAILEIDPVVTPEETAMPSPSPQPPEEPVMSGHPSPRPPAGGSGADDHISTDPDDRSGLPMGLFMITTAPRSAVTWHDPAEALSQVSPPRLTRPLHCGMLAVDIAAFSGRDPDTQQHLRGNLYQILEDACEAAGLPWRICHHEDRGDGILLIAPPAVSAELLDPVAVHLRAGLRRYNRLTGSAARMQLRMAIHAGYVRYDRDGASGRDLIHLFRLLDAQEARNRLATSHAEFVLITSDYLYEEVIRHGPSLIEPAAYQHVTIANKETIAPAWIWHGRIL